MIFVLVSIAIGAGICVDLFSCYVGLRRNRGLTKSSGLLGVTLIACYLLPLLLSGTPIITTSVWSDAVILLAFHVGVVLVIPWTDRAWRRSKDGCSE